VNNNAKEVRFRNLAGAITRRVWFAVILTGSVLLPARAPAQSYPDKTVYVIANSSPGALTDLFARVFAQKFQERTGRTMVVENRPAATGVVGAADVAKSDPDGYTLLVAGHPSIVTFPLLNPKTTYTSKDLAPIALLGTTPSILLVKKDLPVRSVQDLISMAQAKPGTMTYGSQGIASSGHMAAVQFTLATDINIIHVPFRGSAPALAALVGGQVDMLFETVRSDSIEFVKQGMVRALAVAAQARVPAMPDVPTMAEAGVPDVESGFWVALYAPAHTPPDVVHYLNKQAVEIFSLPEVRKQFGDQDVVLSAGSPEDLSRYLDGELKRWGDIIHRTELKFPG
jgi:tripartite-type tricarboxylate transporter receptor subunit TctC